MDVTSNSGSRPPRLQRETGTSLHRQLFLVLREQIARGSYAPGTPLPTEEALCQQFGVSRITVRRALQDLEAQGFVERRHGRGTYIRDDVPLTRPVPPLPLLEGLRKVAIETHVDVIEAGKRPAPPPVAMLLHLPAGAEAVFALRVRRRGTVPLMITEAWLPARFAHKATPAALRKHPLYDILLRAGVKFGRLIQEVSAEAADPLRARLLSTDIGAPLVRVTRLLHDVDETPIQHLTVYLSPERSRILMEIPANEVDSLNAGYIAHDVAPSIRPPRRR